MDDLEVDEGRSFHAERSALVEADRGFGVLLHEGNAVLNLLLGQRQLLEGLVVHKVVQIAVVIKILHDLRFDDGLGHLIGGVEAALNDRAGDDVFNLGANESGAFAGLHVLEVNDRPDAAIPFHRKAFFEIASCYHGGSSSEYKIGALVKQQSVVWGS